MLVIFTLLAICSFLFLFVSYEPKRTCSKPVHLEPHIRLLPDIFNNFNFKISGVSFYQQHLARIAGEKQYLPKNLKLTGVLCREPFNWHNQHTVVVYIAGYKVGRLGLQDSRAFCDFMQSANLAVETQFEVECLIIGGRRVHQQESEFDVKLNLPPNTEEFKWHSLSA